MLKQILSADLNFDYREVNKPLFFYSYVKKK